MQTIVDGNGARRTPYIVLDLAKIKGNYASIKDGFGGSFDIFYSVKANNHPAVLAAIRDCGGSFDVASANEIKLALSLGARPEQIAFSNPVKIPSEIAYAFGEGVRLFAADSSDEIDKLAAHAPGSSVYVRLSVDNTGSGWPLSGKFGIGVHDAVSLLEKASKSGLTPAGLTFHVGSQCENVDNWRAALNRCADVWRLAKERGMELTLLNIGGGVPATYVNRTLSHREIGATILATITELVPGATRFIIEPGRSMVAEAGVLGASVIGTAMRGGEKYVYLDIGVFNGLMETYECFWYPIECHVDEARAAKREIVTLAGPSCDSVDVIVRGLSLPPLQVGDRVVFKSAGAYTNSYETYNGFAFPPVHLATEGAH